MLTKNTLIATLIEAVMSILVTNENHLLQNVTLSHDSNPQKTTFLVSKT